MFFVSLLESFDGPSLIIAYAPCIAHGIDLIIGPEQQKAAVESGHWPLYRFDPRLIVEGKAPLQMDSKLPTKDIRDYMLRETRYKVIKANDPERFEQMVREREFENNYKAKFYDYMSKFKLED